MEPAIRYIALLRGINVGKQRVEMGRLTQLFTGLGYDNVKTVLNTGNVAFDAPALDPSALTAKIERVLHTNLGFEVPVLIRTQAEIRALVNREPFKNPPPGSKLYVTFIRGAPTGEVTNIIPADAQTTDLMAALQKQYGRDITTRNWNTVLKMVKL